jgi:hypothetical protein
MGVARHVLLPGLGVARAYLRDLPDAELHMLDGGHWALETNLDEIVILARDFLVRVHA